MQEETSGWINWYVDYGNDFKTYQRMHFIHVQFNVFQLFVNVLVVQLLCHVRHF